MFYVLKLFKRYYYHNILSGRGSFYLGKVSGHLFERERGMSRNTIQLIYDANMNRVDFTQRKILIVNKIWYQFLKVLSNWDKNEKNKASAFDIFRGQGRRIKILKF